MTKFSPKIVLPTPGGPQDDGGLAGADPAVHHAVQTGYPARDPAGDVRCFARVDGFDAGVDLDSVGGDAEGVLAFQVVGPAHLDHPEPAPVDRLAGFIGELDDAVGQRELRPGGHFRGRVLPQQ